MGFKTRTLEGTMDFILRKSRYDLVTGCWLFEGAKNPHGYGHITVANKSHLVHRVTWKYFFGEPKRFVLHKRCCPNANCWAPEHLYDGNYRDNALDREHIIRTRTAKVREYLARVHMEVN